ncbi:DUF7168 domain-containing protein [Salinispora pacifica]|uniref:DUF7168 domain-containing protein n=1 Tax=Salinispora pacifica TaxID=351187 RepID=UPI0004B9BDCC|nr:hypothetical protein [Salinispora pacifica]
MLAATNPTTDVIGDTVVVIDGAYALDKQRLLGAIAIELGCKAVYQTRYPDGKRQYRVHLFGYGSDLERVDMLFTSLLVQATHGLAGAEVPLGENATAYRKAWLTGFTEAIASRLHQETERAKQRAEEQVITGASVALVLADRLSQVEAAKKRQYGKLRLAKQRTLTGQGIADGAEAGNRAELGGPRVDDGGGRRMLA